jgi:DNA-binding MarR family transcriptional regulator
MLSIDQHICFAVYSTAHMFNRLYQPMLDKLGITYPQYLVLIVLAHEEQMSVGALGERLKLESSTLTPMLKRLEAAGLITRNRAKTDERVVLASLTPAATELLKQVPSINVSIADAVGETDTDRETMRKKLIAIRDRLEAAIG